MADEPRAESAARRKIDGGDQSANAPPRPATKGRAAPYRQTAAPEPGAEAIKQQIDTQTGPISSTAGAPIARVGSTFAHNDRPRGDDRLGFKDYAAAFAALLRNPATQPPLTIGIYASWGMGKSFLMQLIREALETGPPAGSPEFIFVDFNAWVYSGSDNLWAGLISRIYERVEKRLGSDYVRKFREGRNRREQAKRLSLRVALYLVPALVFALLALLGQVAQLWTDNMSGALGLSSILIFAAGLAREMKNVFDFVNQRYTERARQFQQQASRPDYRDKIGFMNEVKSEIDFLVQLLEEQSKNKTVRLAIFIDDLDRCPPAKAVEVLEAIMLLLSEDRGNEDQGLSDSPFFVFLGLDARVLVRAIEDRYGKVLAEAGISGYEYLDKIVQIPFTIPATDTDGIKNYLRALLPRPEAGSLRASMRPPSSTPQARTNTGPMPAVEEVSFTDDERAALDDFADYISHNPRRAKRIVNIYRLLRILDKQSRAGLSGERSRKLIKWVILNEQWPYRMGLIIAQRQNAEQLGQGPGASDGDSLGDLYVAVGPRLHGDEGRRLLHLDDDPEIFMNFIRRDPTAITAADIRAFEPLTFNLNPAIGGEVRTMLARAFTVPGPEPRVEDGPGPEAAGEPN